MRILLVSALILLMNSFLLQAQDQEEHTTPETIFSLRVDRQSSGSGHQNFTSIGASYKVGGSSIYAGALLEDRNKSFQGMKVSYRFYPNAFNATIRPYFQYQLIGRWGSRLTKDLEQLMHKEGWSGKRRESYRTFEHYLGFGLEAPLIAGAYADIGVGMGIYHSRMTSAFDDRIDDHQRFRQSDGASLSVNVGLGYAF